MIAIRNKSFVTQVEVRLKYLLTSNPVTSELTTIERENIYVYDTEINNKSIYSYLKTRLKFEGLLITCYVSGINLNNIQISKLLNFSLKQSDGDLILVWFLQLN